MKNRSVFFIFVLTTGIIVLVFLLLFFSLVFELKNIESVNRINKNEIFYAIKLSIFTASVSSIIAILIGIPVAYLIARYEFPGKVLITTIFDITIVTSPLAIGSMLLIFFNTFIGKFIENNVARFVFEIRGIIVAQFFVIIGYAIRFLNIVFESIDKEYENIARTLGASFFDIFTKISLPLSYRGIIATFMLVWARAIGEFGATITVAGATTMKTETLPIAIFLKLESADVYQAIIFIIILIILSLSVLFSIRKILNWRKVI